MGTHRTAGELVISEQLRTSLARLRVKQGTTTPAHLPIAAVRQVESQLATRVDDSVWALLAATGRDPFEPLVLTEDARDDRRLSRKLIAFAYDPEQDAFYCVPAARRRDRTVPVCEWTGRDAAAYRWPDMASFVNWRFELRTRPLEGSGDPAARQALIQRAALRPALIDGAPIHSDRRVLHTRFGEGRVVREIQGPPAKLEVDFGALGRKLVLASFVSTALDGGAAAGVAPALEMPRPRVLPRRRRHASSLMA